MVHPADAVGRGGRRGRAKRAPGAPGGERPPGAPHRRRCHRRCRYPEPARLQRPGGPTRPPPAPPRRLARGARRRERAALPGDCAGRRLRVRRGRRPIPGRGPAVRESRRHAVLGALPLSGCAGADALGGPGGDGAPQRARSGADGPLRTDFGRRAPPVPRASAAAGAVRGRAPARGEARRLWARGCGPELRRPRVVDDAAGRGRRRPRGRPRDAVVHRPLPGRPHARRGGCGGRYEDAREGLRGRAPVGPGSGGGVPPPGSR